MYAWDANGNSTTVDNVGLTFDVLDRMVEQNRSGTHTEIVYSPGGAKLALMSGQTLQKAFVPLPGRATAVYTSSGLDHYRHSDWLGSARLTSSPTRTVLSTTAYAPFGETYAQSGTADLSFTGQNQDTVSGDYDFLYRKYSTQGRWASPDPAGLASVNPAFPQSWNRYAYVLNNPLRAIDPLGLDCVFLTDDGSSVAEIAPELDAAACGDAGGVFFAGSIDPGSIQTDPNSDWVFANGMAGDAQFSCGGGVCDQGSFDAFYNSIGTANFGQVSANLGSGNTSDVHGQAYYFFKDFSVFGPKNDPRPSCFAGFLKELPGNLFGYSGADITGGVATAAYILTPPSPVPPTMALRGGKYALNWIKADNVARATRATSAGLAANLVFAEALALGNEIDSALSGNCK